MHKRLRQYAGVLSAALVYYIVHEGAHLLYAVSIGVFETMNFLGLGIQIDVYSESMTDAQMCIFCIAGSVATTISAYILVALVRMFVKVPSKLFKACMYYITAAMLFIDPLYLSILYRFLGGGDMNGISLLFPELFATIFYAVILIINLFVFIKIVFPEYKSAFEK